MGELEARIAEKAKENQSSVEKRYWELHGQMVNGAGYIESIDESHPHWEAANKKYSNLAAQFVKARDLL